MKSGAAHLVEVVEDQDSADGTMRAWWDEDSDDDGDDSVKWRTLEHKGELGNFRSGAMCWTMRDVYPCCTMVSNRRLHVGVLFPPAYVPHKKKLLYGPSSAFSHPCPVLI